LAARRHIPGAPKSFPAKGRLGNGPELMEKIPMTAVGFNRLQEELKHLKISERPAVIKAIAEAREHGDLSENAEYHAARERQSFIEGRVAELEDKISRAEVINPARLSGDAVKFGATITLADEDTDEEATYQIVGQDESDIKNGFLSISSPLARALIGKAVGDSVEVSTPGGSKVYEIVTVVYR
jgi:transcription elongation factor GreA